MIAKGGDDEQRGLVLPRGHVAQRERNRHEYQQPVERRAEAGFFSGSRRHPRDRLARGAAVSRGSPKSNVLAPMPGESRALIARTWRTRSREAREHLRLGDQAHRHARQFRARTVAGKPGAPRELRGFACAMFWDVSLALAATTPPRSGSPRPPGRCAGERARSNNPRRCPFFAGPTSVSARWIRSGPPDAR